MASNIHVLVIPFPVQGHINPMLQFSKRLVSKGLMVTMVATSTISKSLIEQSSSVVKIVSISDGLKDNSQEPLDRFQNEAEKPLDRFQVAVSRSLIDLIEKQNNSCRPFRVLVYDSMMPWGLDIAHQLGLKGASFFTQSCVVSLLYYYSHENTLRIPDDGSVVSVPSLSVPMEVRDLPSFIYDRSSDPSIVKTVVSQFSNFKKADYLLFNSFDKLENEIVKWMAGEWSIKTIGPTIPSIYTDKRMDNDKDYDLNLFSTNQDTCKNWLDTKNKGSVVYVSFGSLANLKEEQMTELAFGLSNSNISFLWVVRASEELKLPKNFVSETSTSQGKCLIVNWCSQLQVLAHEAVGCFMTHCGWNSTLEALSLGVPIVAIPLWSDQTTNAKFIADVWHTGVRVKVNENGVATREEIEVSLKEVMEGEKGNELKTNALKIKEFASEAVDEGGSSDSNISEFISSICATTID